MNDVIAAYQKVAEIYAERLYHELDGKPFDRELLLDCAARWRGRGLVCDLGCGPGHVAALLADAGCEVLGLDLSPDMVAVARQRRADLAFDCADMLALERPGQFHAVVAFYSIVHFDAAARKTAFAQIFRALRPGGELLLAYHAGEQTVHQGDWWGTGASLDFYMHPTDSVTEDLAAAGFSDVSVTEREPYDESVEAQTRRAYVRAAVAV